MSFFFFLRRLVKRFNPALLPGAFFPFGPPTPATRIQEPTWIGASVSPSLWMIPIFLYFIFNLVVTWLFEIEEIMFATMTLSRGKRGEGGLSGRLFFYQSFWMGYEN